MANDQLLKEYQHHYRSIIKQEEKKGFTYHLYTYLLINAALIIFNLLVVPDDIWFYWPLLGWGIGLIYHYMCVRESNLEEDLERKESLAEKRMREKSQA